MPLIVIVHVLPGHLTLNIIRLVLYLILTRVYAFYNHL